MKMFKKLWLGIAMVLSLTLATPVATPAITNTSHTIEVDSITKTEVMVYVTPTGKKYHTHKCGNGKYTKTTLKKAKARGLTPCKKCY